jgi:DNA polymerase III epsilon subunit-like protein
MFATVPMVVGWNCGNRLGDPYDMQILDRDAQRYGITLEDRQLVDVMPFGCQLLPLCDDMPNRQLPTVARFFGIDTSRAHRAGGDCSTTLQVLERLAPRLPADYAELLELSIRWARLSWWLLDTTNDESTSPAERYRVNCGKWAGRTLGDMARDRSYRGGRDYLAGWMRSKSGPPVQAIINEVLG